MPRLSDVVADLRELASTSMDEAFLLGTDVSEAFRQVPLHESERQFTVAALAGKCYVFKVLIFGSSRTPTVWGRYAAFLGRSTAAVVGSDPLWLQVYVDDPLYPCLAELPRAARLFSVALLWALVYPLAWHKTEGGSDLRCAPRVPRKHQDPDTRGQSSRATQCHHFFEAAWWASDSYGRTPESYLSLQGWSRS